MENMKTNRKVVIEKAAQLIRYSGLEALTIPNLEIELGAEKNQLNNQFTKVDDILLALLVCFETELNAFIQEITNKGIAAETELQLLFKRLYSLFMQKPYYLSIIFDKNLTKRDDSIKMSILRIKNMAERLLTTIINSGKMSHAFKTKISTKLLVGKIISDFRLFMKDEQRINEMILELKNIQNSK